MEKKRSVEHYRDHELICEVQPASGGWTYTVHVLGHQGDRDVLRGEECSATSYKTDLDALSQARKRSRELVDELLAARD